MVDGEWQIVERIEGETICDVIRRQIEGEWYRVEACQTVGATSYLVIEEKESGHRFAAVGLLSFPSKGGEKRTVGYRLVREEEEPKRFGMSRRLLRKLSRTADARASVWRSKCWRRAGSGETGKV